MPRRPVEKSASRSRGRAASEREPWLADRLVIPAPPMVYLDRPRLLKRLGAGARGPLTLVSAPAGTGKTVLVASWAAREQAHTPLTWISLEDLDPATCWPLVVEGLARAGVDVPSRLPALGTDDGNGVLAELAARVAAGQPLTMILDCDPTLPAELASALDYLLRNAGGQLHLVVIGRFDPLLALHKYKLANTIVEIRLADLAFTEPEARSLLAGFGVELSPSLASDVTRRTQGWAAGLQFAAMTLVRSPDHAAAVRDLHGDGGAVAEYLLAEVLNAQPLEARDVLLGSSIVDVMQPGLVEEIAGPRARRAMAVLAHGNAFLDESTETPGQFTYQPLFRELLRAQLSYESPELLPELHRAAARWLAAHGQFEDAVRHALAGGAWEEASGYVVDGLAIVQLLVERQPCHLRDMLAHLPNDAVGVSCSLVRAALAMAELDVDGCARHADEARQLLELGADGPRRTAVDLAVQVLLLARSRGADSAGVALEAAAEAERLIRVQPAEVLATHPELPAMVLSRRGRVLLLCGRLDEAAAAFASATRLDEWPRREYPVLSSLGHLALLAAWNGHLRQAEALGERAVRLQAEAGIPRIWCPAAPDVALALVHVETYDLAAARRHARRAAE